VKRTHITAYKMMGDIRDSVRKSPRLADLADVAGIGKKAAELLDDLRKEATKLSEFAQKVACAIVVQRQDADTIRGEYATATPDVRMVPRLPSRTREPEKYSALLRSLGLPESPMVRLHWPSIADEMNARLREGGSLPAGIDPDDTYPEYRLTTRMNMAALEAAAEERGGDEQTKTAGVKKRKLVNEKTRKVLAWLKTQSKK